MKSVGVWTSPAFPSMPRIDLTLREAFKRKSSAIWPSNVMLSVSTSLPFTFEDNANKNKSGLEESLNSNINQVQELKKTNASLSKELEKVKEENDTLNNLLDKDKNELLLQWFSYGGMVAGVGLLLGLILPSIIPSRKSKSRF